MFRRRRKFYPLFFVTAMALLAPVLSCSDGEALTARMGAEEAPDFRLDVVQGGEFSLSEARGKVVILGFWATWCPPCRREIPHFEALHREYSEEGLIVLGASLDDMSPSEMRSFIQRNGISYPIVMATREVLASYGNVRSVPTTFIVDRSGRIVERVVGYRAKEFFEERIRDLL